MTELILKKDLDSNKMKALLDFLKSWGVEAEFKTVNTKVKKKNADFSLTAGLWDDYPISSEELRTQAWKKNN